MGRTPTRPAPGLVLAEEGYLCGAMGFSGDIHVDIHCVHEVRQDTATKGRRARSLRPRPSSGPGNSAFSSTSRSWASTPHTLLGFFDAECPNMPVFGAAAAGPQGPMVRIPGPSRRGR
ncbi:MAG: hypothetical protein R3B82_24850 [Sandaracinaceae bacterium]